MTIGGQAMPELRRYQEVGAAFLEQNPSAILGDEMGLGKTIQAISALSTLMARATVARALIVTPAALQTNWMAECRRWAPSLPYMRAVGDQEDRLAAYRLPVPIVFATYDQIRLDAPLMSTATRFDLVVLDEAQRVKNIDSTTSLSCRMLRRRMSWALTGTPLENRPGDIRAILRFVAPDVLASGANNPDVNALLRPYFLRRRLTDVMPELPERIDQTILLELSGAQRAAYDQSEYQGRDSASNSSTSTAALLATITRLKQLCNWEPETGTSVKLDALRSILQDCEASGKKVLVFSQYVETLNWISERISMPNEVFHGGLSIAEKDRMINRFKGGAGAFALLMSLKAGGVGLNLQEASVVVLFDRWWNPAVESQAIARVHRMGQKSTVLVYRFLVAKSVEERIDNLLVNKSELFDQHVNSLAEVPPSSGKLLRSVLISH